MSDMIEERKTMDDLVYYGLFSFVVPGIQGEMSDKGLAVWIVRTEDLYRFLLSKIESVGFVTLDVWNLFSAGGKRRTVPDSVEKLVDVMHSEPGQLVISLPEEGFISVTIDPDISLVCGKKESIKAWARSSDPISYMKEWFKSQPGFWSESRVLTSLNVANGLPVD